MIKIICQNIKKILIKLKLILFSQNIGNKYLKYKDYNYYFKTYKTKPRFHEETIDFLGYTLKIPDAVSFAYQVKDIFIDEIYSYRSNFQAPLIYDCGANIGLSILYFKEKYPNSKIIAFEADKKIFNYLKENIEVNGISGVELLNNAVWINNNTLTFNSEGADGGSLFQEDFVNKQQVKAIRLKEMIDKETDVIDVLKMDIEGAEEDVLIDCSGSLKKVNFICLEYHSFINKRQGLHKILSVLTENGFRYHLETINHKKTPFLDIFNKNYWNNMDMQLEIFGWKLEQSK